MLEAKTVELNHSIQPLNGQLEWPLRDSRRAAWPGPLVNAAPFARAVGLSIANGNQSRCHRPTIVARQSPTTKHTKRSSTITRRRIVSQCTFDAVCHRLYYRRHQLYVCSAQRTSPISRRSTDSEPELDPGAATASEFEFTSYSYDRFTSHPHLCLLLYMLFVVSTSIGLYAFSNMLQLHESYNSVIHHSDAEQGAADRAARRLARCAPHRQGQQERGRGGPRQVPRVHMRRCVSCATQTDHLHPVHRARPLLNASDKGCMTCIKSIQDVRHRGAVACRAP